MDNKNYVNPILQSIMNYANIRMARRRQRLEEAKLHEQSWYRRQYLKKQDKANKETKDKLNIIQERLTAGKDNKPTKNRRPFSYNPYDSNLGKKRSLLLRNKFLSSNR
jgi:uncharacterized protein YnzC (UPF0291/DUF896 family)